MSINTPLINVMTRAVEKAGRALVRDFGEVEQLQVSKKGPADFVSNADHKAEGILRDELSKARPRFGFLMEESGEVAGDDGEHRWIVDPLDGTTNFLHGMPHWAISVALEQNREIVAGIVYDPVKDEMFQAQKGVGAFLGNRRIRVSSRSRLPESVFATGIPFLGIQEGEGHRHFLRRLETVMSATAGVRRWGAASLDLAYVAAGRYEGFWERGLKPWDIAAGLILVREAGGIVSDVAGGRFALEDQDLMATNEQIHATFVALMKPVG